MQLRRVPAWAGAIGLLAIATAAAVFASDSFGGHTPAQIDIPSAPAAITSILDGRVPANVEPATLRRARTDGDKTFFVGEGRDPGTVCLVVASGGGPNGTVASGCDTHAVLADNGMVIAQSRSDGGLDGAILLPAGYGDVTVNGTPVEVIGNVAAYSIGPGAIGIIAREGGKPTITQVLPDMAHYDRAAEDAVDRHLARTRP